MPCWYYEKKELRHSPSVIQGISLEDETMYRREGARFILQLGNKMGLRYETMATGVVYFHRFYMVHTFQEFPRHVTACCCLFLAGKVEETPKKCKDIMRHARSLVEDTTWAEFGADPREEVMTLERILLQTIKFDFIVEHPYTYLLKYAKCLKGDKKKLQSMVQMAWTFVNDGLCTTLCLQWEPEIIAIALMYLAGKLNKFEVTDWQGRIPRHEKWWDMFVQGISMELLEDICHQVLDLYSPNKSEPGASGAAIASGVSSSKLLISTSPIAASGSSTSAVGSGTGNNIAVAPATPVEGPAMPTPQKGSDAPKGSSSSSTPLVLKKAKKEEIRSISPVKTEPPTTQAAPYPYTYNYPTYPAYPPPSTTPAVATPPSRYSYPYPPSSGQHAPPPQSNTPSHPTQPPSTYQQHPPARFPSAVPTTSPPSIPPPHYSVQPPPPTHYSTSHPPPYPPPSAAAPHYPPPPTQHRPPPTHYSHGAAPPAAYYSPTPPNASSIPPSYQQPPSGSYPPPSGSYSHTASTRQYYPPST